jgi:diguanylate cyclase (GGDEF)-like protein
MGPKAELYKRRRILEGVEPKRSPLPVLDPDVQVDVGAAFEARANGHHPPAREMQAVLARIGSAPSGKPWDCGACGFRTCWDFAEAMLNGRATLRACPPYQEKRAQELADQASVDELTGLATFRVLRERLTQELARSDRSRDSFAVLFLDLDRFKKLNDERGHEAANRVLEAVGAELQVAVRATDLAARYGGDEFVALLVRTGLAGAVKVAEAVRGAIQVRGLGATLSIGVAAHDPEHPVKQDVLERADRALYQAKAAGGNAVVADVE